MKAKKNHFGLSVLTFFIFFIIILLNFSGTLSLTVKTATPFLPLPLLCAYSFWSNTKRSAIVGFLVGACADSTASGTLCFNTVSLMLIATLVCLSANSLFNKNLPAAAVISLITSIIYFSAHWFIFHIFGSGVKLGLHYFLGYSLPSALYTAIFIFPFYFIFKYFAKIKNN